ncbi:MAG TPA: hypothetical protein VHF25_14955 [Nitriliruptorales bacterium]|nr:hypothetical protein [Nitriliruptorales bacterium]
MSDAAQPPGSPSGIRLEEFRHRLRTHPRVATPHLEVIDLGDRIVIAGAVPDVERRRAVDEVAAQLVPGREIDNRVQVGEPPQPPDDRLETEL